MTGASLWPIAGAAGIGLARATAAAVSGSLSFAAELARGIGGDSEAAEAEAAAAAEQRREDLQRRIEQFAERIRQQLEAAGFDVSQPLTLTSDGLGGIAAADHPHHAAIEQLLEGDMLLLRDFERLADEYETAAANGSGDSLPGQLSIIVTAPGEQ